MSKFQTLLDWLNAPQTARLLRLSYPFEDAPTARLRPNHFKGIEHISRGFEYTPLHASAPTLNKQGGIPALEIHRYEGHYGFKHAAGADALARRRMIDLESRGLQYEASGNCDRFIAGRTFSFVGHFGYSGVEAEFLVTQVEHEASNNYLQDADEPAEYKSRILCQPKAVPWQPGLGFDSTETRILAPQTATVVGPDGAGSLHVDQYGRVKVRFHWDRDETSSCWVRVASGWAGGEKGFIGLPRVGSEGVIFFLDGNPDHPLLTSCVYNQRYMPPWKLPEQAGLTGLEGRELNGSSGNSPGGRSNHIVMEDTAGRMQVQIHSDHLDSGFSAGHIGLIEGNAGRTVNRGQGIEAYTQGHGVVRPESGLLLTTEALCGAQAHITDMGETTARLAQSHDQHDSLAGAARQAQAQQAGDQDEVAKAIQAQNTEIKGRGGDPAQGQFPEFQAPHLVLASPAGIQSTTQGSTHVASVEHTAFTSGGHTSVSARKSLLVSVKEAVKLFAYSAGMKLIAAAGDIDITALKNSIKLLAQLDITQEADTITLRAKTQLKLIGGGSFTTLNAAGIEHGTNGTWRQQAANHSISGPANAAGPTITPIEVALKETPPENQLAFSMQTVPGLSSALLANQPFTLLKNGGEFKKGMFDAYGRLSVDKVEKGDRYQVKLSNGLVHELPVAPERMQIDPEHSEYHDHRLSNQGYRTDGLTADARLAQIERGTDADAE